LLALSGFGPGTALHGAPVATQEEVKPTTQKIR
jgi:hypothetical protein